MTENRSCRLSVLGAALTLFGGACWGLSGSVGQFLFSTQGMDTRWLIPIRLTSAGIVLIIFSIIKYGKKTLGPFTTRIFRREILIYGLLGVGFSQFTYFLTIQLSTAAIATILQDLAPLIMIVWFCLIRRSAPKPKEIVSFLLAFGGVFLLVTHMNFQHLAVSPAALLTGILCAVGVAVYNISPVHLLEEFPVPILQGWSFVMSGIVTGLIFRPWTFDYHPRGIAILGICTVIILGNLLAFPCYVTGLKYIGPEKAVLYGFAEPVSAAIISAVFLGTGFTVYDALGFAMIFAMMIIISRPEKEN